MTPQEKLAARIAAVTKTAPDYTKTVSGGGGAKFEALAAGPCRLRLVSYVELGIHESTWGNDVKKKDMCRFTFEVTGPKHPPRVTEDGKTFPNLIYVEETLSRHEKANFVKLFALLNYEGTATHPLELLGKAYLGTVCHRKWAKRGEPKDDQTKWTGIDVELRDKTGYHIRPPRFEDPETGDVRVVEVAPAVTPLTFFVWHDPDMEQWDSIFIEGEYPERKDDKGVVTHPAKSKNVIQSKIISASNFKGSPMHELLLAGGKAIDFTSTAHLDTEPGDGTTAPEGSDDPLAGVASTVPARSGKGANLGLDDDIPY